MNKYVSFLLVLVSIFISIPCYAKSVITIVVNQKKLDLSSPARIENGTTLVPLRNIFEAFDVTPSWNKDTQVITAEKNGVEIWLQINNKKAKVGNKEVMLSIPAKTYSGNTLVPLRFISEAFGVDPVWNKNKNTIYIGKTDIPIIIDNFNINDYFNLTYGDIKNKYGKSTYKGYYNGGRAINYDHLNLGFLFGDIEEHDLKAKVQGLLVFGDTYIWGIKDGMSINEVKYILGTPEHEGEDESGEGYEWYLYYKIGQYSLWISSHGPQEPIELIQVHNK